MPVNQTRLAKELGISKSLLTKYKQDGAPIEQGAEAVRQWRAQNVQDRVPLEYKDEDSDLAIEDLAVHYDIPTGEEPSDALARLRKDECRLFAQIESIEAQLLKAPNAKLARKLPVIRKQWVDTSKAATAVWRVISSMNAGSELEEALDCAERFIELTLGATLHWIKTYHNRFHCGCHTCNSGCRTKLFKHVEDTMSKLNVLIPNVFAKSGLEDLKQRALDAIEKAKANSDIEPPAIELEEKQEDDCPKKESALQKLERQHRRFRQEREQGLPYNAPE